MSYLICGIDEVGRGALAGPLLAVAAVFQREGREDWKTENSPIIGVNDSKTFTSHGKRVEMFHRILRSSALHDFGIGEASVEEINQKGIDEANRIAFMRAWLDLKTEPNWMLIDGQNPCPGWPYSRQDFLPKGDALWWPVGAASILAKVIRDNYMIELGLDFPLYQWARNAGYGTKAHVEVLTKVGSSPHHRTQFIKNIMGGKAA